jgi:ABC-type branched-subunit amino acid transport system ATPase component/branched-subunit amino acid ABC-type transport system permease component
MDEAFRFALLGLGAGSLYAIAAIGLVLVYRGSGVVNFAQGAMGMVGAYAYYEAHVEAGLSEPVSFAIGLLVSALIGAAFYLLIIRNMREASNLAKIVATLALLLVLTSIAFLNYGALPKIVPSWLPNQATTIFGAVVGEDRVWIFGIVVVLTTVLWVIYKFTKFGIATTAVAENPRALAALAVSPDVIATANWAAGGALGAFAAMLLVPITGLDSGILTFIVIPILAAAVVGRFSSFPITTLAGLGIGIAQSEVTLYGDRWSDSLGISTLGWATAVPFVLVTVILIARGRSVAGKDERFGRMPKLGTGKIAPGLLVFGVVAVLLCTWVFFPSAWVDALQIQLLFAILLMSFVVVTGFAGQLSLAQATFAGLGALFTGRVIAGQGWSFEIAIIAGVLLTIPVGIVLGLAGMRARGVNLAIVTLGFAIAVETVVFANPEYLPGSPEIPFSLRDPKIFGISVGGLDYPERYTTVALIALVIVGLVIVTLRLALAGRRLIAVRTNERAAAALGISVMGAKMYAFVLGGMIAALAGSLLAFRRPSMSFFGFSSIQSILFMQNSVLGGVGTVVGPQVGSGSLPGTLGTQIFSFLGADVAVYLTLISGFGLLFLLTRAPDGIAFLMLRHNQKMLAFFRSRSPFKRTPVDVLADTDHGTIERVAPHTLHVDNLTVRFGGVTAVDHLTLDVAPGEIVGLIGPNGAGKSTTIDAITGVTPLAEGSIRLDGDRIDRWGREHRARSGIGRSFQSLELFDDLTVLENILAACDKRDQLAYMTDLVAPGKPRLTEAARTVVVEFDLGDDLGTRVDELHYGQRRRLAIARAVAGSPSILLLDEPAAGLDEQQSRHLGELVRRLADDWGMGVLLVEHNVDMVLRTCDRVYALDFGALVASGTPAEIRANPAVVESYLGTAHFRADGQAPDADAPTPSDAAAPSEAATPARP